MRMTVPVTMRALIQRNRKLRHDDHRLRTARGWFSDLGHYYALDFKHKWIVKRHVEPEALGSMGQVPDFFLTAMASRSW